MKSYKLFFLTTLIFSIAVLLVDLNGKETLDINVHDTYFIIARFHIWLGLTIFLCILTCGYFIMQKLNRKTNKYLTVIHYVLTFLPLTIIPICINLQINTTQRYRPTYEIPNPSNFSIFYIILYTLIALAVGQLVYLINIITSKKTTDR